MSDSMGLERRYRRLLTCFPAQHRNAYGEEMIGVLLAASRPGQRRPGLVETLDMFGGAARIRLRARFTGSAGPGWRNALALTSLIAPVLLVTLSRVGVDDLAAITPASWSAAGRLTITVAVLLVPVLLGLIGLRHVGAVVSAGTAVWIVVQVIELGLFDLGNTTPFSILLLVQAAALAASPGPRYALRLLTPAGLLMALPWAATAAYMANLTPGHFPLSQLAARLGIAAVAVAGLPALASATGRRLILLTAVIPLSGMAVTILTFAGVDFYAMSPAAAVLSELAPPVLLAVLTAVAVGAGARQRPDGPVEVAA